MISYRNEMWYWSEWSKLSNKAPELTKKVLFQLGGEVWRQHVDMERYMDITAFCFYASLFLRFLAIFAPILKNTILLLGFYASWFTCSRNLSFASLLLIPDICHFFTLTYFEAWKFYTQKCVNLRQKLPRDKIA